MLQKYELKVCYKELALLIKLRDAYRACCKHLFMSCVKPRFFVQFLKFKRFLRYYKFISHGSEDRILGKKTNVTRERVFLTSRAQQLIGFANY